MENSGVVTKISPRSLGGLMSRARPWTWSSRCGIKEGFLETICLRRIIPQLFAFQLFYIAQTRGCNLRGILQRRRKIGRKEGPPACHVFVQVLRPSAQGCGQGGSDAPERSRAQLLVGGRGETIHATIVKAITDAGAHIHARAAFIPSSVKVFVIKLSSNLS